MKLTQRDFNAKAPQAARRCRIFFFCGQDEAGASAAAARLVALLPEPGERVELAGADLRKDPALLGDEARSNSLFGGTRHIWVRATGDDAHDAVKALIETADAGEGTACPVLVVASSATDKSRTAKLLEKREDAAVAMFYPPDLSSVTQDVRAMADSAGVGLGGDLAERIARSAGLDVRLAQSEVTKLALYLDADPQAPVRAQADDLDAIGAHTEEDGFGSLVNAVLSGETAKLSAELHRMRELSLNPVGLLLAFERRVAQLAGLAARLGSRGDIAEFVMAEKNARRIFWRDARDMTEQLKRWRGKRLERLVEKLTELHRALMADNRSADLLLAQGLTEICRKASSRR